MFVPAGHFRNCGYTELNYGWFDLLSETGRAYMSMRFCMPAGSFIHATAFFFIDGYGAEIN